MRASWFWLGLTQDLGHSHQFQCDQVCPCSHFREDALICFVPCYPTVAVLYGEMGYRLHGKHRPATLPYCSAAEQRAQLGLGQDACVKGKMQMQWKSGSFWHRCKWEAHPRVTAGHSWYLLCSQRSSSIQSGFLDFLPPDCCELERGGGRIFFLR